MTTTKKFLVPFDEQETVWSKYQIVVEAETEEDAFNKVREVIDRGDSVQANFGFDKCEFVEITEHISSDCKYSIDDYSVDNIEVYETKSINQKIETKNYTIEIMDEQRGYFEHNVYGDENGGGLWFEDEKLVDFDGVSMLPIEVADALIKFNYKVDKETCC